MLEQLPTHERYSFELRNLLSRAQQIAAAAQAAALGQEHVYAAFRQSGTGLGAPIVSLLLGRPPEPSPPDQSPVSPPQPNTFDPKCSTEVLALFGNAVKVARQWHHNFVGSEHVVFAMLQDEASPLARALRERGQSTETAQRSIQSLFGPS